MVLSKHFRERLLERCGIVLTEQEETLLLEGCRSALAEDPVDPQEERVIFDILLPHKATKFSAVYIPKYRAIATAFASIDTSRKYWQKRNRRRTVNAKRQQGRGFYNNQEHRARIKASGRKRDSAAARKP